MQTETLKPKAVVLTFTVACATVRCTLVPKRETIRIGDIMLALHGRSYDRLTEKDSQIGDKAAIYLEDFYRPIPIGSSKRRNRNRK